MGYGGTILIPRSPHLEFSALQQVIKGRQVYAKHQMFSG
jgi:hypothetical protein